MQDFRKTEIEGAEALVGRTVSEIRARSANSGTGVQRLAFLFDDGSSLVIDGSFPACSYMESPLEALADIEGRRFGGISCRSLKTDATKAGRRETALLIDVVADGYEVSLHWICVGRDGFDVTPEPRIHVTAWPYASFERPANALSNGARIHTP